MDEAIEELGDGYGGDQGPAEGPVWWKEGGYLLFSDIHNNRRMRWSPEDSVTVFREPNDRGNGLTRDLQGRLVACERETRRVTRLEHDGSITVIANSFRGRQLNRPNDVVVKSDGSIYFTDPWTFPKPPDQWDLEFSGVYRVSPDIGTLTLLAQDFILPNGLAFSPDESILYINDTRRGHIRAFDLLPTGALATDRVVCDLRGERPRGARRHESGRGGQCPLRRGWWHLGYGLLRKSPGHNRPRAANYHEPGLGRRRLEDAVHHHVEHPGQGPSEDFGNPGAAPELRLSHRTHSRYQDNALSVLPGS